MENCKACKEMRKDQKIKNDLALAVAERANKRLFIVAIILMLALFITNGLWIYRETQFEDVEITQENADGYNNYIGNDGDILNGEAEN